MIQVENLLDAVRCLDVQLQRLRILFAERNGLSRNDANALTTLTLATAPMTPTQLAGELGMTGATVTAVLDRLEAAGFVRRERNSRDRRSVQIAVQPSSRTAVAQLQNSLSRAVEEAVDDDERADVAAALHRLGAAFERTIAGYSAVG